MSSSSKCVVVLACLLLAQACHDPETIGVSMDEPSLRLAQPEPSVVLTDDQRANIRDSFDPEAVQELLRWIPAENRAGVLAAFQYAAPGQPSRSILHFGDPVLDEILDRIWQPYWRSMPAELLARDHTTVIPGRALAIRLRFGGEAP